jgi:hypothetical protein
MNRKKDTASVREAMILSLEPDASDFWCLTDDVGMEDLCKWSTAVSMKRIADSLQVLADCARIDKGR